MKNHLYGIILVHFAWNAALKTRKYFWAARYRIKKT